MLFSRDLCSVGERAVAGSPIWTVLFEMVNEMTE